MDCRANAVFTAFARNDCPRMYLGDCQRIYLGDCLLKSFPRQLNFTKAVLEIFIFRIASSVAVIMNAATLIVNTATVITNAVIVISSGVVVIASE